VHEDHGITLCSVLGDREVSLADVESHGGVVAPGWLGVRALRSDACAHERAPGA
jgi:hypothetical protein